MRLGRISTLISAIVQMMTPVMIRISRLITITVSQNGNISRIVSVTKADAMSILSAIGSR